jgi:ferric-dicitrate binding protein FerR (iron transport regulator)
MSGSDPTTLSNADLQREIQALQARAFERYEDAALQAEAAPDRAEAIYARAERETAPWIERANALNAERVARYRRRAARWRQAAIAVTVIGSAGVLWLTVMR